MTDSLRTAPSRGARWLRSISLLAQSDGRTLRPHIPSLVEWIPRFSEWYLETIGVGLGQGQHLLYGREISVIGQGVLKCHADLVALAEVARACGYGFSITADIGEMNRDPVCKETIDDLAERGLLTSLGINIFQEKNLEERESVVSFVEETISRRVPVGIIGSMDAIRSSGLTSSEIINGADVTWYPISTDAALPRNPVQPCYSRLRLFVDATGFLYPCLGLVGIPQFCFGDITQPVADTMLADEAALATIDGFARRGAGEYNVSEPTRYGLPGACEQHLRAVTARLTAEAMSAELVRPDGTSHRQTT